MAHVTAASISHVATNSRIILIMLPTSISEFRIDQSAEPTTTSAHFLLMRVVRYCLRAILVLGIWPVANAAAVDAEINSCRELSDTRDRLACYDRIDIGGETEPAAPDSTQRADQAEQSTSLSTGAVEPNEPQRPPPRRKPPPRGSADLKGEVITEITQTPTGRYRFRLDNGELWEQTEPRTMDLRIDDRVDITESFMGSWTMRETGGGSRSFKVRRLE